MIVFVAGGSFLLTFQGYMVIPEVNICPQREPKERFFLATTRTSFGTMLDISALIPNIQAKLDKMPSGHALDLRTYKRNRSVIILKKDEDSFLFLENGFHQDRFTVSADKVRKTLKKMLKKEFPRSRKVRVYDLGAWDEDSEEPPKLKTL